MSSESCTKQLAALSVSPQYQTPPSSWVNDPPTPPHSEKQLGSNALRIIAIAEQRRAGGRGSLAIKGTTSFQLAAGEFDEIRRRLGGLDDLKRYEYYARTHLFVLIMPTARHESFSALLAREIALRLEAISQGSDRLAAFAKDCVPDGSPDYHYPEPGTSERSIYSPDEQFCHVADEQAGVIIEIANSQTWKDLKRKAIDYLIAGTQVVVGVKFDYGPRATRKATLSVWRLEMDFSTNTGRAIASPKLEAFRNEQGEATNSPGLSLQLSDFASKELSQELLGNDNCNIVVSGDRLHQLMEIADMRHMRHMQRQERSTMRSRGMAQRITVISSDSSSLDSSVSSDEEEDRPSDPDWDPDWDA